MHMYSINSLISLQESKCPGRLQSSLAKHKSRITTPCEEYKAYSWIDIYNDMHLVTSFNDQNQI